MRTLKMLAPLALFVLLALGTARCGNAPSKSTVLADTTGDTNQPRHKLRDTSQEGNSPKKIMLKKEKTKNP